MAVSKDELRRILRERFGLHGFLSGQEEILSEVLAGRDTLAVLPTGGGKSLIYQMASQILPGLTIVVSPLLSLMKDQVDSMREAGLTVATLHSLQTAEERRDAERAIESGRTKIVYVTPERFGDAEFEALVRNRGVSLFAVDEAHCISRWGHDFRPSYLSLGQTVQRLGGPTILALTATAPPLLRAEIVEHLGMRNERIVLSGVDRPNLFFEVIRVEEEREDPVRLQALFEGNGRDYPGGLADRLREAMQGSGIVYCATTAKAQETAEFLQGLGIAADFYHGQRRKAERQEVQDRFMRGDLRVVCATNAFGLGIDKPDIRFIIHRDIPAGIEEYFQEAGRAGRDGAVSRCTLIYRSGDLGKAAFLSATAETTREQISAAADALDSRTALDAETLRRRSGLGAARIAAVLALMQRHEAVVAEPDGFRLANGRVDEEAIEGMLETERMRKEYERSVRDMMMRYAESDDCRRRMILNYFGDDYPAAYCDFCDNDLGKSRAEKREEAREILRSPFTVGQIVEHERFGRGTVEDLNETTVTVLFESGYRVLDVRLVKEQGMLGPAGEAR